jgi:succinate dehydrogenase / fumarate reductase cytochrome b subunit
LGAGSLSLVLWLGALAHGSQSYRSVMDWYTCIPGKVMMMGWAFCYYYHLANGVRHLIWDTGVGYELKTVYISGWIVIGFACLLTALTVWWIV